MIYTPLELHTALTLLLDDMLNAQSEINLLLIALEDSRDVPKESVKIFLEWRTGQILENWNRWPPRSLIETVKEPTAPTLTPETKAAAVPEESPKPAKQDRNVVRHKGAKFWSVHAQIAGLLRESVANRPEPWYPLENALTRTWGPKWSEGVVHSGNARKKLNTPKGMDLFFRLLAREGGHVSRVMEGDVPADTVVSETLQRLAEEIKRYHSAPTVRKVLIDWGCPVDQKPKKTKRPKPQLTPEGEIASSPNN